MRQVSTLFDFQRFPDFYQSVMRMNCGDQRNLISKKLFATEMNFQLFV